jgi:hypothetical protein
VACGVDHRLFFSPPRTSTRTCTQRYLQPPFVEPMCVSGHCAPRPRFSYGIVRGAYDMWMFRGSRAWSQWGVVHRFHVLLACRKFWFSNIPGRVRPHPAGDREAKARAAATDLREDKPATVHQSGVQWLPRHGTEGGVLQDAAKKESRRGKVQDVHCYTHPPQQAALYARAGCVGVWWRVNTHHLCSFIQFTHWPHPLHSPHHGPYAFAHLLRNLFSRRRTQWHSYLRTTTLCNAVHTTLCTMHRHKCNMVQRCNQCKDRRTSSRNNPKSTH